MEILEINIPGNFVIVAAPLEEANVFLAQQQVRAAWSNAASVGYYSFGCTVGPITDQLLDSQCKHIVRIDITTW